VSLPPPSGSWLRPCGFTTVGRPQQSPTGGFKNGQSRVELVRPYGKMVTVTVTSHESADHIERDIELRRGTAVAREDSWLALLVAGVIVLAAMPFYRFLGSTSNSTGCTSFSGGFTCRTHLLSNGFFGMGLGSSAPGIFGNSSPGATTYWVISIFLGVCVVVGFYWVRSREIGNVGRIWPIVTVGLGALVLGAASRNWFSTVPTEMTIRGMQSLLIIALGLIVLAAIDQALAFSLFVAGFFGLALLSCLYNVSNLFARLGISSHWPVEDQTLPNLILPGIYLLIGAAAFWALHHWKIRANRSKGEEALD
jgi:hypothetical protein